MTFHVDTGPEDAEAIVINEAVERAYRIASYVYFDIETIPTQCPITKVNFADTMKPPENYKNEDTIANWKAENLETEIAKTSFDAALGHICTISVAINNSDIQTFHAKTVEEEAGVIANFFDSFSKFKSHAFSGHNVIGFDIPFVTKRAVILGIPMPKPFPRNPKPWDKACHDTMQMWGGTNASMDKLCRAMGINGKDGFDGSMVAEAWANGDHDTVAEYCADDVARGRLIHQRFLSVGF